MVDAAVSNSPSPKQQEKPHTHKKGSGEALGCYIVPKLIEEMGRNSN